MKVICIRFLRRRTAPVARAKCINRRSSGARSCWILVNEMDMCLLNLPFAPSMSETISLTKLRLRRTFRCMSGRCSKPSSSRKLIQFSVRFRKAANARAPLYSQLFTSALCSRCCVGIFPFARASPGRRYIAGSASMLPLSSRAVCAV